MFVRSHNRVLFTKLKENAAFPKHFFELFLHIKRVFEVFERQVWRVQAAHLHNAARALSSPSLCFHLSRQRFCFFDIVVKKQIECDLAWCIVLSTTMCHHMYSGQNLLQTHSAAPRESTTFWPLWWRISLSIRLYTMLNHIRFVKLKFIFTE